MVVCINLHCSLGLDEWLYVPRFYWNNVTYPCPNLMPGQLIDVGKGAPGVPLRHLTVAWHVLKHRMYHVSFHFFSGRQTTNATYLGSVRNGMSCVLIANYFLANKLSHGEWFEITSKSGFVMKETCLHWFSDDLLIVLEKFPGAPPWISNYFRYEL